MDKNLQTKTLHFSIYEFNNKNQKYHFTTYKN